MSRLWMLHAPVNVIKRNCVANTVIYNMYGRIWHGNTMLQTRIKVSNPWITIYSLQKLGPAIKDSLFDVPQGVPRFGLSKMTEPPHICGHLAHESGSVTADAQRIMLSPGVALWILNMQKNDIFGQMQIMTIYVLESNTCIEIISENNHFKSVF